MVWKPVYAVPLKSVGGVEAPCCCLSFAGAPHSGRPMLIGLQDGDIVSGSYSRSDNTQVKPKSSTSYLWLHQSTPQIKLPRAELGHSKARQLGHWKGFTGNKKTQGEVSHANMHYLFMQ